MKRLKCILVAIVIVAAACCLSAEQQRVKPTLYLIATPHLESQWNWTVQDTIRELLPRTFQDNSALLEKFEHFKVTFDSAIHYMWFKEYYPELWPRLQSYVSRGQWNPAGSWITSADTNIPSPESLLRQALYGKRFFRQEVFHLGSNTVMPGDMFLPDSAGFSFALPSIAAQSGLNFFSTQKLTWGGVAPFPIGRWIGVDGSELVGAFNAGSYTTPITEDISTNGEWFREATPLDDTHYAIYRYFGSGDSGGAPASESIVNMTRSILNPDGVITVRNTASDQFIRELTNEQRAALPLYEGELLLKTHGTGGYTSQAAMKAWNRQNEQLAAAAEHAAALAEIVAGVPYPRERLRDAWIRFLWHQSHQDLAGTAIPQAYEFSWNDELTSLNQFAGVIAGSSAAIAATLDTRDPREGQGGDGAAERSGSVPVVVYNPGQSSGPVEAAILFPPTAAINSVHVWERSPSGPREVPAQLLSANGLQARILFMGAAPPMGYAAYTVQSDDKRQSSSPRATASPNLLENERYSVRIDANGDISSIFDKDLDIQRELLKAPIRLSVFGDESTSWPAWEIASKSIQRAPLEYLNSPLIRIVEQGPVRVSLEVTRRIEDSIVIQRIRLAQGTGAVEVETLVDWKSPGRILKAEFPFTASNLNATYDLGLGVVERGNDTDFQTEVPAQQWADITDASGEFGVAVLNDSKYGWDKPAANTLRLTLLRTPMSSASFPYQGSNDIGHHRFVYAIAGHRRDWRFSGIPSAAASLNQAPIAFQTTSHTGRGNSVSILTANPAPEAATCMSGPDRDRPLSLAVSAFKKAEDTNEWVVRVQEQFGVPTIACISTGTRPIIAVRETNAAEEHLASVAAANPFSFSLKPYQARTFALTLRPPQTAAPERVSTPLTLPFSLVGTSASNSGTANFDGRNQSMPAEQFPSFLQLDGWTFQMGRPGAPNVYVPRGEQFRVPAGTWDRLYFLASAVQGDNAATFTVGGAGTAAAQPFNEATTLLIREWQGPIGQWDSRLKPGSALQNPYVPQNKATPALAEILDDLVVQWNPDRGMLEGIELIQPGYVKRDEIAWVGTHRNGPEGKQPYVPVYIFLYSIELPPGSRVIQFPSNNNLRIFAATLVREPRTRPAVPMYAIDLPEATNKR